jgi:hypothetical protein
MTLGRDEEQPGVIIRITNLDPTSSRGVVRIIRRLRWR